MCQVGTFRFMWLMVTEKAQRDSISEIIKKKALRKTTPRKSEIRKVCQQVRFYADSRFDMISRLRFSVSTNDGSSLVAVFKACKDSCIKPRSYSVQATTYSI